MDSASPFAGILIGQPTLNHQLRLGVFGALDQRIATRFTIKAMDIGESFPYLRHHVALAGRDERSSPMTPSQDCTAPRPGYPGRSTTPPSPPSSPRRRQQSPRR
jgi:type II secretory pathway predicted ATPase ExeA